MKKVKISKYTKEKNAEAWRKYREENASMSHGRIDNMIYIIKEAWLRQRGLFWSLIVCIITAVAENICLTYTDKAAIELALGPESMGGAIAVCVAFIAGSIMARFFKNEALRYEDYIGKSSLSAYLNDLLIKKKMDIDYEKSENTKLNDLLQKARGATSGIAGQALDVLKENIIALLNFLAFGGILSMLSPAIVLIVGLPCVAGYYINRHKMLWIWNMSDNWQNYDRQLGYVVRAGSDFSAAKDIRLFGMQRWFDKIYKRVLDLRANWYEQQDKWERIHDILELFISSVGNIAAYIYIIFLVINGSIGAGDFILYFNSIFMLYGAVRSWCNNYGAYQWLSNNICYMRDYLDIQSENGSENIPDVSGGVEIEFKNVSYKYPFADEPTIKNVSFVLKKGERLAVVGLNGAGKTTLIKLMCGLYKPTEGEILLNGAPTANMKRDKYFKLFSAVFQDITSLPVTVAENIAGAESDNIDMDRLTFCMRKAGIYEKIQTLPDKENTRLVKGVFEDAVEFSGGEMQKLALAKALYKNAPVLLLDEPTAALDAISEQNMYLSYAEFSKDKSSVFISHRLASTRFCDRIFLIENGVIAENGTHTELMNKNGKYAELFNIQSSYYTDGKIDENDEEN